MDPNACLARIADATRIDSLDCREAIADLVKRGHPSRPGGVPARNGGSGHVIETGCVVHFYIDEWVRGVRDMERTNPSVQRGRFQPCGRLGVRSLGPSPVHS